jgi:DNA-binding response OmpR family regulator
LKDARILLVEDDCDVSEMIEKVLTKEGYKVRCAFDGQEALNICEQGVFELLILDIMLPEIDGLEVMRRIRIKNTMPIIIISAKAEESDRIIGLGLGADDYLIKPFSIAELAARVKANLRRYMYYSSNNDTVQNVKTYGDIKFDLDNYTVTKNHNTIKLTAKEYEILKLFFENPNKVFTKAQIFNSVWGEEYLGDDNTVMVHIRRLRNKIEDNSDKPKYIETVWGIGYRLGNIK